MKVSINEIKSFLNKEGFIFEYFGAECLVIEDYSPIQNVKPKSITWLVNIDKYDILTIDHTLKSLIVVNKLPIINEISRYNFIVSEEPRITYFEILNRFFPIQQQSSGVAPTAIVETMRIGHNVSIGHHCYICGDVSIGDNVVIKHNVVIECPTVIGNDCIIESGVVIGTFGYQYYKLHGNKIKKVSDFGGVILGNRVEVGANTCIARGTLSDTVICDDVKIDNLCHIAHNVYIGKESSVIALSMLAGSCRLEQGAYIAPGAMIKNQTSVGKNAFVGLGAVVVKDVEANKIVAGVPAKVLRNRDIE